VKNFRVARFWIAKVCRSFVERRAFKPARGDLSVLRDKN
jgi:hypothetical protein